MLDLVQGQGVTADRVRDLRPDTVDLPDRGDLRVLEDGHDRVGVVGVDQERLQVVRRHRREVRRRHPLQIGVELPAMALKVAVVDEPVPDALLQQPVQALVREALGAGVDRRLHVVGDRTGGPLSPRSAARDERAGQEDDRGHERAAPQRAAEPPASRMTLPS